MNVHKRIATAILVTCISPPFCTSTLAAPALFAAQELQVPDTVPSEADLDRPFEDPLPAQVTGAGGKRLMQLANCREYLAVRNQIIGSTNENDYQVLLYQTVPCAALALLKSASVAQQTALPEDFQRQLDTTAYPATLWPAISNDERQLLAQSGATLHTASQKTALHTLNDETLELKASRFGLRLTLLARGDFDNDGWEDAAFRWQGDSLDSRYTYTRLVVLTRTSSDKIFRELLLEPLLPALPAPKSTGSGP